MVFISGLLSHLQLVQSPAQAQGACCGPEGSVLARLLQEKPDPCEIHHKAPASLCMSKQ